MTQPKAKIETVKTNKQDILDTAVKTDALDFLLPDPLLDWQPSAGSGLVVAFRSAEIGDGSGRPDLGKHLMSEFLQAVGRFAPPPSALLFYSGSVVLTRPDSPELPILRQLAAKGTEILVCRISFDTLAEGLKPAVGRPADWPELADRMRLARQVLWP